MIDPQCLAFPRHTGLAIRLASTTRGGVQLTRFPEQISSHAVIYFFREIERILTGHCLGFSLALPGLWHWLGLALLGRGGVSRVLVACLAGLHPFFLIKRKRESV